MGYILMSLHRRPCFRNFCAFYPLRYKPRTKKGMDLVFKIGLVENNMSYLECGTSLPTPDWLRILR